MTAWHGQADSIGEFSPAYEWPRTRATELSRRLVIVNATLLMLTSAWIAGADPAPAKDAPAPIPAVVSTGSSCGGGCCSACGDSGGKSGLWTRFKGSFGKKSCCESACAPAPVQSWHVPAATCGGCSSGCGSCHDGLWSQLKGRFNKHNSCDTCSTCGSAGAVTPEAVPAPTTPKKEMPKDLPSTKGVTSMPIESNVTPVAAPKPAIQVGNPF